MGLRVNARRIQRVFCDIGVPVLTKTPRRRPRQMTLFEKEQPGDSVQVDVKVIKLAKEEVFQYTALDDCTGMQVLGLYPRQNQHASLDFLKELADAMPFAIRNESATSLFTTEVIRSGISLIVHCPEPEFWSGPGDVRYDLPNASPNAARCSSLPSISNAAPSGSRVSDVSGAISSSPR